MIYILSIIFFLIFVVSFFLSNKKLYAPAVIVSALWTVALLLFIFFDHDLNQLHKTFLPAILIWVVSFSFFSLLAQSLNFNSPFKSVLPSKAARDIYFYFSIATLPFLIMNVQKILSTGFNEHSFNALRQANVEGTTAAFFVSFWLISFVLELFCLSNDNRWRVVFLFLINLFYAVVSLGKTNFLTLFAVTFIILWHKKIIKMKAIILGSGILFAIFVIIQILRSNENYTFELNDFISMYFLSGMPAFETVLPNSSHHFGENTFRFFYALSYEFGFSKIEPVDPVLQFIKVPTITNTYTVLYPFYKDFGYPGIAFFSSIMGFFYGWIFKKMQLKDFYFMTLYAVLSVGLMIQFMNETIFTLFSQNLQYIIIALFPFIISKYHLFEKKIV